MPPKVIFYILTLSTSPTLSGTNVGPTSEVCMTAMLMLLMSLTEKFRHNNIRTRVTEECASTWKERTEWNLAEGRGCYFV